MRLSFVERVTFEGFTYQAGNAYDVDDALGRRILDTFKGGEVAITDTLGAQPLVTQEPAVVEGVDATEPAPEPEPSPAPEPEPEEVKPSPTGKATRGKASRGRG